MNKTLLLAGVATALFAFNANAMDFNPYVSGKLTYGEVNVDGSQSQGRENLTADIEDKVYGFNAAVGVSTKVPYGSLRGEFEFGYKDGMKDNYSRAEDVAQGATAIMKADIQTYMFNMYYDIDTGTKFTPYVGAGIGYAKVKTKASLPEFGISEKSDDNNLAWQVGAGVSYAMTENISFDVGYRYTDYGSVKDSFEKDNVQGFKATFNANSKYDVTSHEFLLGARYAF